MRCAKGTYVRSLARDIARALGTVGHVTMLRRTKAGPFTLDGSIPLDKLEALGQGRALEQVLLPMTAGLDDIPALALTPTRQGGSAWGSNWPGSMQTKAFILRPTGLFRSRWWRFPNRRFGWCADSTYNSRSERCR